jgi:hypothetical protein
MPALIAEDPEAPPLEVLRRLREEGHCLGESTFYRLHRAERIGFQVIDARYDGPWELPVLGAVTTPTAVLIRPDGYVARVGDRTLGAACRRGILTGHANVSDGAQTNIGWRGT